MNHERIFQLWSNLMAQRIRNRGVKKTPKKINVQLIAVREPTVEFQERKLNVETMVTKIIILANTRGRPRKNCEEEFENAA
jgi:hypothetical protein